MSVDTGNYHPKVPQSWNRYAYTMNSPLKATDPDGKATQLVVGDQTNKNPFGHVALAINGRVYSFGTQYTASTGNKDWGGNLAGYLSAQEDNRTTELITLNISAQQEQKLQQDLDANNPNASGAPNYNELTNSCVTVTESALIRTGTIPPPQSQNAMTADLKPPGTTPSLTPTGVAQNVGNAGIAGAVTIVGKPAQPGFVGAIWKKIKEIF